MLASVLSDRCLRSCCSKWTCSCFITSSVKIKLPEVRSRGGCCQCLTVFFSEIIPNICKAVSAFLQTTLSFWPEQSLTWRTPPLTSEDFSAGVRKSCYQWRRQSKRRLQSSATVDLLRPKSSDWTQWRPQTHHFNWVVSWDNIKAEVAHIHVRTLRNKVHKISYLINGRNIHVLAVFRNTFRPISIRRGRINRATTFQKW